MYLVMQAAERIADVLVRKYGVSEVKVESYYTGIACVIVPPNTVNLFDIMKYESLLHAETDGLDLQWIVAGNDVLQLWGGKEAVGY